MSKPTINGNYFEIRKILKQARRDRKITQEKLAHIAGYSAQAISLWELGLRCPGLPALIDWANSLGYKLTIEKIQD